MIVCGTRGNCSCVKKSEREETSATGVSLVVKAAMVTL